MKNNIFLSDKEKLRKVIAASRLNRSQIARKLGVSYKAVYRWLDKGVLPHPAQSKGIDLLFKSYVDLRAVVSDMRKGLKIRLCALKAPGLPREIFIQEAVYHSNAFAGSRLSLKETAMVFEGKKIKGKQFQEVLQAVNLKNALELVLNTAKAGFKIDEEYILKLHEIIMYNFNRSLPGKYRAQKDVFLKMKRFLKQSNHYSNDPIGKIANEYNFFLTIHPFMDGNARIAWLVMAAQLLKSGFAPAIIRIENRDAYLAAMSQAKSGDINNITQIVCDGAIWSYQLLAR